MSIIRIDGGNRLDGSVSVHGAKNSVLPIMAASLLACGETVIHNCPSLSDVDAATRILTHLGCQVRRDGDAVFIDSTVLSRCEIPHDLMREMRSSVIFLGAILARLGEAVLSMPGGCELGPRPIDLHLFALRAMGAEIEEEGGNIHCKAKNLHGCRINMALPSVGATENAMLAAASCDGTTIITNAACEPEIWDLQNYMRRLGYNVHGAGTSVVTVSGKGEKGDSAHWVIPDRIVAATYLTCAASAGGIIELKNVIPGHLSTVVDTLSEMGCDVSTGRDFIIIRADRKRRAVKPIITRPYPGFPTDAQPPLMAASLTAEGTTVFVENIFENRYRHAAELLRMGADIKTEGRVAIVSGVKKLRGAPITSTDLRGGAALVVAALGAEGTTEISGVGHIDRGYADLVVNLRALGADIERLN
ncbi:UDP-N-acetylglucosamine 1-carboxyvinyltransferase [Oscillospiraceae bacterium CM]|nr:UDP-N-acetylglucosamine 1-carboxyvinyltransferase [Oscillospiraceae bacterium CM]